MISKILGWFIDRSIEKRMEEDPKFKEDVNKLREDYKELNNRLDKVKKDDPDFYDEIKDLVA